jgi:hypothetical protein
LDPAIAAAAASLYWAEVSAIAAAMAAIGTFLAPLFALQVSAWLQRRRDKQRQRFALYQTLLQWRATPFLEEPVRALNSIDTVFNDVRAVRDAWSDLFSAYNDQRLNTPEGGRIRQDRLTTLLQVIAHDLGYERHFTKADFKRFYNPESLSRYHAIWIEQQRQTYETMFSQKPPSPPPPNQEGGPKG